MLWYYEGLLPFFAIGATRNPFMTLPALFRHDWHGLVWLNGLGHLGG